MSDEAFAVVAFVGSLVFLPSFARTPKATIAAPRSRVLIKNLLRFIFSPHAAKCGLIFKLGLKHPLLLETLRSLQGQARNESGGKELLGA